MGFQLRRFAESTYRALTSALDQARRGDGDGLRALVERAKAGLDEPAFRRRNASFEWLVPAWRERLDAAERGVRDEAALRELARVLVPLLCMPDFQYSPWAGPEESPNLVVLGESDGGLFLALRDRDEWFDRLFLEKFASPSVLTVADGDAMVLLTREEEARLGRLAEHSERVGSDPARAEVVRQRLLELIRRVGSHRGARVSVTTRGA